MSTLAWVLAGIVVYWFAILALRSQGMLPSYVGVQGPVLTVHTQRGKRILDRLASRGRFWRAWANFGLGVTLVVMAGMFLLLVIQAITVLQNPPPVTAANQPQNVLVIPGVNRFLPLSVAPEIVLGLLVGLVVHEGGHGLLCRVEGIDIESMGIALLAVLPIGAFVEPDEEERQRTDRGSQSRMFAAGVTNNFALTVVAFALLFGPVVGSIGVASGAAVGGVHQGSPAATAGIDRGDRITAVNGREIETNDDLRSTLDDVRDRTLSVTTAGGETTTVNRSLLVVGMDRNSPLAPAIERGSTVTAVNGTNVYTTAGLDRELADRPVATLTTANGTSATAPIGALVTPTSGGPVAEQTDIPANRSTVITAVGGERVVNGSDLLDRLSNYRPNETVTVTAHVDGTLQTYRVTLGERDGEAIPGVTVRRGISGMTVNDSGVRLYPAGQFLDLLGGGSDVGGPVTTFLVRLGSALVLPFATLTNGLQFNFAGFVEWNAAFYVVEGPLSVLGGGVFGLANVLFWAGWVNLNLGLFNCIPAYPLDGGRILRMGAEAVVSRLPTENGRSLTSAVTTSVGLVMLASLVLMVFGPELLAG